MVSNYSRGGSGRSRGPSGQAPHKRKAPSGMGPGPAVPPVVVGCKKPRQAAFSLDIEVVTANGMPRRAPALLANNAYLIPRNHAPNVVCRAITGPNDDAAEHAQVAWTLAGVAQAAGQTLNVPTNACGQLTVTATYQGIVCSVDIWVIWCTLVVRAAGAIPAGCNVDFSAPADTMLATNPTQLGTHQGLVQGVLHGVGRVCVTGTFAPAGVHAVLAAGIRMKRTIIDEKTSKDGGAFDHRQNVQDDTVRADKKQWRPDANDEIFDLDAPNVAYWPPVNATIETYMHFGQWVEYYGARCSADAEWHFIGEILFGNLAAALQANPVPPQVVHLQQPQPLPATIPRLVVGAGALAVAAINAPRYAIAVNAAGGYDVTNSGEKP